MWSVNFAKKTTRPCLLARDRAQKVFSSYVVAMVA